MKFISWLSLFAVLTSGTLVAEDALAATKKFRKRSEISSAERAIIYKSALNQCRKKYGARLHHVEVEYQYGRYFCYVEG